MINYVLAGKYKDKKIYETGFLNIKDVEGQVGYPISKHTISSYQVMDETTVSQFSGWKSLMGMSAFGTVGMTLGIDGENKKEYLISIEWLDGEKSLILINWKCYKALMKTMF